jgi:hypothetical protein
LNFSLALVAALGQICIDFFEKIGRVWSSRGAGAVCAAFIFSVFF